MNMNQTFRSQLKKSFLLLMLAVATYHNSANAQENKHSKEFPSIALTIGGNLNNYDFNEVNSHLSAAKLPQLKNNLLSISGGLTILPKSNSHFFVDINTYMGSYKETSGNADLHYTSRSYDFNLDYLILDSWQRLYPSLGFGQTFMEAKYSAKTEPQTFNTAANSFSDKEFDLQNLNYLIVKLNYEVVCTKDKFLAVKATAGYRIGLNNQRWTALSGPISDDVKTSASGFYAALSLSLRLSK